MYNIKKNKKHSIQNVLLLELLHLQPWLPVRGFWQLVILPLFGNPAGRKKLYLWQLLEKAEPPKPGDTQSRIGTLESVLRAMDAGWSQWQRLMCSWMTVCLTWWMGSWVLGPWLGRQELYQDPKLQSQWRLRDFQFSWKMKLTSWLGWEQVKTRTSKPNGEWGFFGVSHRV